MEQLPEMLRPLADPNVAFLLFVLGAFGLTAELVHPNLVTGLLGGVCLVGAFIGFGTLPLNLVGLLFVALGFVLFVLEAQIASHGLLTIAGVVAIAVGASMLYSVSPSLAGGPVNVAPALIVVVALGSGALGALIAVAAVRTRRMLATPGTVGTTPPAGTPGTVQKPLEPLGTVHLGGETWSARTADESALPRDTPVRLVSFDGLVAVVEPDPIAHVPANATEPAGQPAAIRP